MRSLHWPELNAGDMDRLLGQGLAVHGSSCQAENLSAGPCMLQGMLPL